MALGEKGDKLKPIRLQKGVGIAGWVVQHGEPVITNDTSSEPRFFRGADEISGFITKNMVCVPVRTKERIIGALQAINKNNGTFEYDDMVIIYALANQIAIAIENAQLYQESITDGLTGLFHHKYFELRLKEELDRSKRYKHPLTLIIIDIDFFKKVNDTYGHIAGDKILERIAILLKENTRLSDIVARYGGEEFAVILPHISYKNALTVGERLRKSVEDTDFQGVRVTISLGMGYFNGDDINFDYKEFVDLTDKALYQAKNSGRNKLVFIECK